MRLARSFLLACAASALASIPAVHAQAPLKPLASSDPADRPLPTATAPPRTTTPPTETREQMLQRAYFTGSQRNMNRVQPGDPLGWKTVARYTGLGFDELVNAYDAIAVVDIAYRQLLGRAADSAGAVVQVNRLRSGDQWQNLWRDIAQSVERDQRFGYWAPAPIATTIEAQQRFGLTFTPNHPEQCFGALGDRCEGGAPQPPGTPDIQPRWVNPFTMPDGTKMGYVEQGIAVGSIAHDGACLAHPEGLNCHGGGPVVMVISDVLKSSSMPAAKEWAKAFWNTMDGRTWRDRFGPYPVDVDVRHASWYDDLRPTTSREAWLKDVHGPVVDATFTLRYAGIETRNTARLSAPAGRGLDEKDGAFCRSKAFARIDHTPFTTWGVCR